MRAPGTMSTSGSSGPVPPTVAPYPPSTDYTCDDLRPATLTPWLLPELCSFPALRAAPGRSALALTSLLLLSLDGDFRIFDHAGAGTQLVRRVLADLFHGFESQTL